MVSNSLFVLTDRHSFGWCYDPIANRSVDVELDCTVLFDGDDISAITLLQHWTPPCTYSDADVANFAADCPSFKSRFQFSSSPLSGEEAEFPLAFVLVVEKEAEQVARLFARLYQPQNLYCLTYDNHSSPEFKRAMDSLIDCFPDSIVTPSEKRDIFWADFSILAATMDCLEVLARHKPRHRWKYVQILSWNDIPLRTNLEMVRILKLFDGANDVELSGGQADRFRYYHVDGSLDETKGDMKRPVPPDGLIVYKGSYAATMSRDFVSFLLENPAAKRFLEWSNCTWAPEEQFWSTLVHNVQLNPPGAFPGSCLHYYDLEGSVKPWISRYQIWEDEICHGEMISGSCVLGVGDLALLKNQTALVAHKFYSDFQPAAWYCMHRRLHDRTQNGTVDLDMDFYANLPAVKYQKLSDKDTFMC